MNDSTIKRKQMMETNSNLLIGNKRCFMPKARSFKLLLNKTLKNAIFALMFGTIFLSTSCSVDNNNDCSRSILSVTDIHFTPFHDSLIVQQLIKSPYTKWDTIFSQINDSVVAAYDEETSPELLDMLLESMSKHKEDLSAIVFTGDVLEHDFNDMFYEYAGTNSEEAKNNFIYKTMGYVSLKLRQTFPNTPIYFSLGNNDSYSGDYALVDNGSFLQNTTKLFYKNFINPMVDTSNLKKEEGSFAESYSSHGYYNQKFPAVKNGRIIGLNTIFFSVKYSDTSATHNPGKEELKWLEEQLSSSEKAGEKVWLLLHIPPGINVYTTQHDNEQQATGITLFWQEQLNKQYLELVQRYHKTIVASFAGHTHMDDFRLIYNQETPDKEPFGFIHISPSVSPVFGNNPTYQVFKINGNTGTLKETTTYYVDLTEPHPNFKEEYVYSSTYNVLPNLSGLDSLYQMMLSHSKMLDDYINLYPIRSSKASIKSSWQWYWSGIGNLTSSNFIKAYEQTGTKM